MRVRVLAVALAVLAGCAPTPRPMIADYVEHHPPADWNQSWEMNEFEVRIHFVERAVMNRLLARLPFAERVKIDRIDGLAAPNPDKRRCDLYVLAPRSGADKYRMYVIGHELMHCQRGLFHSPSKTPPPDPIKLNFLMYLLSSSR